MAIKKRPKTAEGLRGADLALFAATAPTIDCTTGDIEKLIKKAIKNDADAIELRLGQYNPDLTPGNFQCLVKFSDRTRAWACAVHVDPFQALVHALKQAESMSGPTMKERVGNVSASKDATGSLRGNPKRRIKPRPRKAGKRA